VNPVDNNGSKSPVNSVEFDEYNLPQFHQKDSGLEGLLVRHGIVKDKKTLRYSIITASLVVLVLSVVLMWSFFMSGKTSNYSKLSPTIKSKFPLSVQALYQENNTTPSR